MSRSEVIWAAVLSAYDIGGASATTLYYATRGFNTAGGDTPADTHFAERIIGLSMPTRSMWSEGGTFGRMAPGDGELFLANGDGALDAVMGYGLDGRTLTIYRGYAGDAFPGSWTKYVYVMDWPEEGMERIRIRFREKGRELDTPFQTTLYTASGNLEGDAALKGKPKPYLLGGEAFNVSPPCVNTTKLIYQVHDGAVNDISDVFDGGVELGQALPPTFTTQELDVYLNYDNLYAITYSSAQGVWVIASNGVVWVSNDAETWTQYWLPAAVGGVANWKHVIYGRGLFLATGDVGGVAYSPNGREWTEASSPFAGTDEVGRAAYSTTLDLWVVGGTGGALYTSSTGTGSWTSRTSGVTGQITDIVWDETEAIFVACTTGNEIITSTDGTTWTTRTSAHAGGSSLDCAAYSPDLDKWVIGGSAGIQYSSDGTTWTNGTGITGTIRTILWTPWNVFYAVKDTSNIYTSTDGITWTSQGSASFSGRMNGAAHDGSKVVVCSYLREVGVWSKGPSVSYANSTDLLDDTLAPPSGGYGVYLAGGYIRLGSSPVYGVTCHATAGAAASDRTHAQLFVDALTEAGKSSGDWSASDITAADTANASVAALWIGPDERPTTAQVLDRIAQSCGAWWGTDRTGVYRFQIVVAPSGTADAELTDADIKRLYRMPERGAVAVPPYQTVIRYLQNYTPQTSGLAAGVTDANRALYGREWRVEKSTDATVQTEHLMSGELVVDSIFATSAGASTEASRVQTLRGAERQRYELRVEDDDTLCTLDLSDVVNITYPRFDLTSGKKFLVTSVKPEPGTGLIMLGVWG